MLILDIKVSAQNRLLAGLLTAAEGCECGVAYGRSLMRLA